MQRKLALVVLALSFFVLGAFVAQAGPEADPNAALRYLNAVGHLPDVPAKVNDEFRDIASVADLEKLSEEARQLLRHAKGPIVEQLVQNGAACPQCDFNPDRRWLASDPVPPFRQLRTLARFLVARGWLHVHESRPDQAIDLWLATFQLGQHLEGDKLLITGMIGLAIRKIALTALEAYVPALGTPAQKERVRTALEKLPRPAVNINSMLQCEKRYIQTTLTNINADTKLLVDFGVIKAEPDSETPPTPTTPTGKARACAANQRVLAGATEMFLMDNANTPLDTPSQTILDKLVADKYLLKAPVCPDGGTYSIRLLPKGEFEISCTKHAKPDVSSTAPESTPPQPTKQEEKALERSRAYVASGQFQRDFDETLRLMDEGIALDSAAPDFPENLKRITEKIDTTANPIAKMAIPSYAKAFEQQVTFQKRLDAFIKTLQTR